MWRHYLSTRKPQGLREAAVTASFSYVNSTVSYFIDAYALKLNDELKRFEEKLKAMSQNSLPHYVDDEDAINEDEFTGEGMDYDEECDEGSGGSWDEDYDEYKEESGNGFIDDDAAMLFMLMNMGS